MSQQKCIVIFALVCCFAILVALIFSAVDIVGEDEDGLSEKNCQNNCRVALVENIPEGINYSDSAPSHLSLFQGWMNLLNMAKKSVDIVSSQWDLSHSHPSACQGKHLFDKLQELLSQNIEIKLVSDILHKESRLLKDLRNKGAEVMYMNLTAYNDGHMLSSFWIVDKQHVYIGSASLEWNSLGQNSPKLLCPKDRVLDIDAIFSVMDDAEQFVYIAVTDYLPIINITNETRYWPYLDGKIREALILRNIKVRLLISYSKETNPLTFNFVSSLKAICTEVSGCSLKVKFFDLEEESACCFKEQKNCSTFKLNRNKYVVTDKAVYIGNFDWVGTYFNTDAGAGLVINQAESGNRTSVIKQLKAVFERDWYSHYAKSSTTKIPNCLSYKHNQAAANKTSLRNVN
nr:PREDICTED: inactive phospholipase D5 isoform X3 [Anolis carolinensis]|eukprot:XP_008122050.1 PREDICTED: inactive phospholipase D5 isoform X3 [Anolis carolinensis]